MPSEILILAGHPRGEIAPAISAGFILLNSLSGLTAHVIRGTAHWPLLGVLGVTVLIGGGVGSYIGAFRLLPVTLQRLLGLVLLAAAFKLFI
jgi:uncharacterized membrane protein YfcA